MKRKMFFTESLMVRRLRWEKRRLSSRSSISLKEEADFHDKDLASQWLKQEEQRKARRWR
jgi:hypothetical protein